MGVSLRNPPRSCSAVSMYPAPLTLNHLTGYLPGTAARLVFSSRNGRSIAMVPCQLHHWKLDVDIPSTKSKGKETPQLVGACCLRLCHFSLSSSHWAPQSITAAAVESTLQVFQPHRTSFPKVMRSTSSSWAMLLLRHCGPSPPGAAPPPAPT